MLEAVLVMVIKAERNKFCGTQTPATALESVFFYVYICIVSFFHLKCIPFTCVRRDILCIFLGDALNTHTQQRQASCVCVYVTNRKRQDYNTISRQQRHRSELHLSSSWVSLAGWGTIWCQEGISV